MELKKVKEQAEVEREKWKAEVMRKVEQEDKRRMKGGKE